MEVSFWPVKKVCQTDGGHENRNENIFANATGSCLSSNFHKFNRLYTFTPRSVGLCTLIPSQLPRQHTAWLCLLVHRTDQFTVPSLPSLGPLFTSLVWRGCGMTYVRLAQGSHYDRLSWDSNPWPSDHWIDTLTNSATVAHLYQYTGPIEYLAKSVPNDNAWHAPRIPNKCTSYCFFQRNLAFHMKL